MVECIHVSDTLPGASNVVGGGAAVQPRLTVSPIRLSEGLQRLMRLCARALVVSTAMVAPLFLSACSDEAPPSRASVDSPSDLSTPSIVDSTTTTALDPAASIVAAVEAGYRAAGDAFQAASEIPDPDFPGLLASHTGPMLAQSQIILRERKANGERGQLPPGTALRIEVDQVTIDPTDPAVARLHFCAVDPARVVGANGEVIRQGPVTVEGRAAMRLVDGFWRLAEETYDNEWEGVAGCAAD